ncbi:5,6-dimethylbenzimidazole synthase, partial [Pseudomonas aeruginosa]
LGPVAEIYPAPMLALEGRSEPRPLAELVYLNRWGERA